MNDIGAAAGGSAVAASGASREEAAELLAAISAVRRTSRRAVRHAWATEPLSTAQGELLRLIASRPGICVADAAHELRLAPNTVSTLVGRLAGQDLLRRERSLPDSRSVRLTITMSIAGLALSRDRLMGIGQAITMPLFFSSNALYPTRLMPGWLQAISKVNPLSYEVDALRGLLIGIPTNLGLDVSVLVGSAVAGVVVASALLPRLAK